MIYIWIAVGAVILCLSGALWWENGRAEDLAKSLGEQQAEVRRLEGSLREAKEVADTNRRLANWWRDETVRSGELLAEIEDRAGRAESQLSRLQSEVHRAKDATARVPASYGLVHRWLRERGAGADRPDPPGGRAAPGAPGADFHPSAHPPALRGGVQR
jgi:hypothetical protein